MSAYSHPRHSIPVFCLTLSLLLSWQIPALAEGLADYDDERPRKVTTVLPPEMVESDLWRLSPEAIPYQGLFQFDVESQFGDFPVHGEAMLRLRLRELRAIAELQGISSTEATLSGAGRSLKKSAERLGYSIMHPKDTAKELPQGTRRLFGKLERYGKKIMSALSDDDENEDKDEELEKADSSSSSQKAAVWLAKKYGGVGSKRRRRARDVGVDPYTHNAVLAAELERVAKAEAVGSVSTKILLPFTLGAIGLLADAAQIAYITDWREVFKYNAGIMRGMGVSEENIINFELHEQYTPMTQTLLIAMLDSIEGATDRELVIEQAILLENETEALFFLESVMLAEWYHRERSPIKTFVANTLIPVGMSEAGNLVAFTAGDYLYWTPETEKVSQEFTDAYAELPGGRELIVADYVSPRASQGLKVLGWTTTADLRQKYDVEVPWGAQDHD